jgi:hypothetical protein
MARRAVTPVMPTKEAVIKSRFCTLARHVAAVFVPRAACLQGNALPGESR